MSVPAQAGINAVGLKNDIRVLGFIRDWPLEYPGSIVRIWSLPAHLSPHAARAGKNRRIDRHINSHTVVGLTLVVGALNLLAEVHGHGRRSDVVSLPLTHSESWVDGTKDSSGANEDEGEEARGRAVPRLLVKMGN